MKIALLGFGKMGKAVEEIALAKEHSIVLKVNSENANTFSLQELKQADVAIEFSTPKTVLKNISKCFSANIPIIVGTTGWYKNLKKVKQDCLAKNQSLLWASNFSIGVNIFFELNKKLSQLMNTQQQYDVSIEEIHHKEKKDAPSGTAIILANQILENLKRKKQWKNISSLQTTNHKLQTDLLILSRREENITGTHTIKYESAVDNIELKHKAHSRKGFGEGAVMAAEWIIGKKGFWTMEDLIKI